MYRVAGVTACYLRVATAMESEWTEYVQKCRWCGRRFRLSRTAWEAAREDAPEQDEDETLAEFDTCLSCTLGVEDPDEIID